MPSGGRVDLVVGLHHVPDVLHRIVGEDHEHRENVDSEAGLIPDADLPDADDVEEGEDGRGAQVDGTSALDRLPHLLIFRLEIQGDVEGGGERTDSGKDGDEKERRHVNPLRLLVWNLTIHIIYHIGAFVNISFLSKNRL